MDNYLLELANQPAKRAEMRARMLELEAKTEPLPVRHKEIKKVSKRAARKKYLDAKLAGAFGCTAFVLAMLWCIYGILAW